MSAVITVTRRFATGMAVNPLEGDWDEARAASARLQEECKPGLCWHCVLLSRLPEAIAALLHDHPEWEEKIMKEWTVEQILNTWLGV